MGDEQAQFRASLPSILSAIKVSGDGGLRLQLDVPDSDMAEALRLLLWRECVLIVTVKPDLQVVTGEQAGDVPPRAKRQSTWKAAQKQGIDGAPDASTEQDNRGQR